MNKHHLPAVQRRLLVGGAAPLAIVCGFASTLLAPGHAQAQPAAPPAAETRGAESETIIVTARRRAEDIQSVPAAITAFGAAQLAQRGIRTEDDLQAAVPGLTVRQTEGSNQSNFAIRGQTVDAFTGSATAVVPYVNDVQLNNAGSSTFYDLESVQALKGPQGTLFGRNATGGAVLFNTAKPTNNLEGYVKGSGGNYSYGEVQGAVNIPVVTDKVLLRFAFDIMRRDGYQTNLVYDDKLGKTRREAGRLSLTLAPNDKLRNTTVAEYAHTGGNNTTVVAYSVYSPGDLGRNGQPLTTAAAATYNPATFDFLGGPGTWARYIAGNPGILAAQPNALTQGLPGYLPYRLTQPFWDAGTLVGSKHSQYNVFLSNTTTYEASDALTIKNILGYSRDSALDIAGEVGLPYGVQYTSNLTLNQNGNHVTTESFSEEFQLQGHALDHALTYVSGIYFQKTRQHVFYPQTYFNTAPVLANIFGPLGTPVTSDYENKNRNIGLFAQGTYDLTGVGLRGLSFTAGIRYSWDENQLRHLAGSTNRLGAAPQSLSFHKPSWEVGLEYKPTSTVLTYVKTRGSWRGGGLNGNAPPINALASGGGNQFLPETAKDVEVGLKYGGDVFGRPAHFNIAAYNMWVDDVQRFETITEPGTGNSIAITVNAPSATIKGVELDTSIRPTDWLTIGGSAALTDAKFGSKPVNVFGTNFIFDSYPDTPKWSGSVFAAVDLPVPPEVGAMTLRGDFYGQSTQFFGAHEGTFIPGTKLPGYKLVNARLDWRDVMGTRVALAAFARNLFNEEYYVGGLAQGASFGINAAAVGRPRMFGVEATVKF